MTPRNLFLLDGLGGGGGGGGSNLKDEATTGVFFFVFFKRRATISEQEQYADVLKYSAVPANSLGLSLGYCALKYAVDMGKAATPRRRFHAH